MVQQVVEHAGECRQLAGWPRQGCQCKIAVYAETNLVVKQSASPPLSHHTHLDKCGAAGLLCHGHCRRLARCLGVQRDRVRLPSARQAYALRGVLERCKAFEPCCNVPLLHTRARLLVSVQIRWHCRNFANGRDISQPHSRWDQTNFTQKAWPI